LLGLEKSWRESSIPREKSLESIQFRYSNVRKREKTKICPHLFFFLSNFFFSFQFVASSHVPHIHTAGVDLPPLHFLLARFRINRIELHTLDVRERERGERRFTHTHTQVVTFFFPFSFGSLLGRDKKKITTRTTFFSPFSLLAIFLPLSLLYCYIREAGGVEGGCCCCWSDIYLYMSLNVFIRRRIIWSSRIVRTMLEVSIFFSGFVTMATARGGGDLVGFYQQCPATQKLEELKLYSSGEEKKRE
jgi:hypothetical protein